MYGAAVGAVQGTGSDMCDQGSEFALRAAGDFRVTTIISADKLEDEFVVAGIDEERDTQGTAAVNGVVKIPEAQHVRITGCVVIVQLNHITGLFRMADRGFAFMGFCGTGHGFPSQTAQMQLL
ncbi:hypothetical protein ACLBW0_23135 [Enterobacteriaceae bacterium C34A]